MHKKIKPNLKIENIMKFKKKKEAKLQLQKLVHCYMIN